MGVPQTVSHIPLLKYGKKLINFDFVTLGCFVTVYYV